MDLSAIWDDDMTELSIKGAFRLGIPGIKDIGLPYADYVIIKANCMHPVSNNRTINSYDRDVLSKIKSILSTDSLLKQIKDNNLRHWARLNRAVAGAFGWYECNSRLGISGEVEYIDGGHEEDEAKYPTSPEFEMLKHNGFSSASLASAICAHNVYTTNHNTTGPMLPVSQENAVRSASGCKNLVSSKDICTAVNLAGHATSKRITLMILFNGVLTEDLRVVRTCNYVYVPDLDSWNGLNGRDYPAGAAVLITAITVALYLTKIGLAGYEPVLKIINLCSGSIAAIKCESFKFHPSSKFLFNRTSYASTMIDELGEHFGKISGFFANSFKMEDIFASDNMRVLYNRFGSKAWDHMGSKYAQSVDMNFDEVVETMTNMNVRRTINFQSSEDYSIWSAKLEVNLTCMLRDVDREHKKARQTMRLTSRGKAILKKIREITHIGL